ncbi:MAG: hypothetical protein M3Y54_04070 [Bacteroidota bacterium]|nr:hypothetical protein [Bacteroidota bacterium]
MKKTLLILLVVIAAVAAFLGWRYWVQPADATTALTSQPVLAVVTPDSSSVMVTGRVSAGGSEPILMKKAGRVRSIYFATGAYVRGGAVLAKLNDYNFAVAPHDGFLGKLDIAVGQYVQPTTVVTTISRRGVLLVAVPVPAGSSAHARPGDSVRVWATARPTRVFKGVVAAPDSPTGDSLSIELPARAPLRLGEAVSVLLNKK